MTRIVVGVDGSKGAQRALDWAVEETCLRGGQLRVVHAWHEPFVNGDPLMFVRIETDGLQRAACDLLDEIVNSIDTSELIHPIEKQLVFSSAVNALLSAAEEADIVVVGARGLGGFAGLLLGSVSNQVVHHAACPVVVVPEPRDAQ